MSGWDVAGVGLVVIVVLPLFLRVWARWSRSFDRHVSVAQALANGPACSCDQPQRRGWLHSPQRCVPPTPPCDCRGSLRDASGVMHDPVCCMPLRELLLDGRWGTP